MAAKVKSFLFGPAEGRSGKNKALFWALHIAAALVWSVGLGLCSLWFASAGVEHGLALFLSYLHRPDLLLLNILPCVIFTAFFWLLTGKVWGGVLFSGVITLAGSFVDYFKLVLRGDPFMAADIALVSEAADMTGRYTLRIPAAVWLSLLALILGVWLSARLLRGRVRPIIRCGGCLLLIGLSGILMREVYFDREGYEARVNIERNAWFLSVWSDRDQYVCRGYLYPFLYSVQEAVETPPEGYDPQEAQAMLDSYPDSDIPDDKKVNVIAIMLEAYNDFSRYEGVLDIVTDPYEVFHALQKEAVSGELVTNIFAGGTIDTERSFITGFTDVGNPRGPTQTYASYMASQGYKVEGGHPGYEWFYNRRNVNAYYGFENYYFCEDRYDIGSDSLMPDRDFFPDILSLFEQAKDEGRPYFNFSVTYQNHGPYASDYFYDGNHVYAADKGYTPEGYRILNNYLCGIKQTDTAIGELVDALRAEEEPVVLVLFGDHLPWLGDNSTVYKEIGLSLDRGTREGFYNYFSTPYVIWANESAKEAAGNSFTGDGGSFSPCFLMNRVFSLLGWEGPGFLKASNELMEKVDVVNSSGLSRVAATGELTAYLPPECQDALDSFRILEYRMKHS